MDRAAKLRMSYAEMLLRRYSFRLADAARVRDEFEARLRDGRGAQERTLMRILTRNADSEYGRRHGFASISGYGDYRERVPAVDYEDLRGDVQRMVEGEPDVLVRGQASYFSITSGSQAAPKWIPGTQQTIVAGCDSFLVRNAYLLRDHPAAFAGRPLYVVGSVCERRTPGGMSSGAMTGFGYHAGHIGFRQRFPYELFTIADHESRYYAILRLALADRSLSAVFVYNPSTLLRLLETARRRWSELVEDVRAGTLAPAVGEPTDAEVYRELGPHLGADARRAAELRDLGQAGPRDWWPKLALLSCWTGGAAGFYRSALAPWVGDLPVRDLGILASEAVVAVPVDDETAGGVLLPDAGFFEFVPSGAGVEEARGAWELERGGEFELIVTTGGGLYRYRLGDVVRVEGEYCGMPLLSFLHRSGRVYSFTGEKLTEHQVTHAVRVAADGLGIPVRAFTAVPTWARPPYYEVRAELGGRPTWTQCRRLARQIDDALSHANVEYGAKRASGRLGPALLALVAHGSFDGLRRTSDSREAQYKEVHLSPDLEYGRELEVIARL